MSVCLERPCARPGCEKVIQYDLTSEQAAFRRKASRRSAAPSQRTKPDRSTAKRKTGRGERGIGETDDAGVDDKQRARLRLASERRPVESGARGGDEQLIEPRAAECATGDLRAWQGDGAIDAPVGRVAHNPPAAPFGVPEAAVGVDGRPVRSAGTLHLGECPLAAEVAAVGIIIVAADDFGRRVGEIHPPAVGRKRDRVRDAHARDQRARTRSAVIGINPADRLMARILVHRAEHQPPAAVELAVVDARGRTVRLDGDDRPARAALEVEDFEAAGEAGEQRSRAMRRKTREPIGQRDRAHGAVRGAIRKEAAAEDVGPLDLAVRGRPEDALAELVLSIDDEFRARRHRSVGPGRAAPQRLDCAAAGFLVEPAGPRSECRAGRAPGLRPLLRLRDERRKTRAGVLAVARLARELLGEDDDHAILGRSRAGELDEADRDIVRQARRAPDVEPELDRARYLVDILPARTRRTDEAFDDLALVNEQIADFHASTGLAAHRRASTNAWKLRDLLSARSRCGPIRLANSICPPKGYFGLKLSLGVADPVGIAITCPSFVPRKLDRSEQACPHDGVEIA